MKKFVLLFTCMFFVVFSFAQTDFQDLSLDKALEKAKVENKLVFMDCYTSWCGPCKMMAEKILPLKEVGEYMNGRFVCIKVDMEKGEGPKLAQKYQVSAYPTFLVIKTDGTVMHRIVGGMLDGKEFIRKVDGAFDQNSAASMSAEYMAGNRKMEFLLKYTKALLESKDIPMAKGIALDIITSLEDSQRCTEPYLRDTGAFAHGVREYRLFEKARGAISPERGGRTSGQKISRFICSSVRRGYTREG